MKLKPNSRYLIIHADDGGLCHSVNRAIIEALEAGIVTSTSLMVPCPQFEEVANFFLENPQYDVGIHLTLTCEYPHYPWSPISDTEKVSSLVNSNGHFRIKKDFIIQASPEAVELELRAQIDRFLKTGLQPTHLDIHQGAVFHDLRFLEMYVKLGLEYRIPPMLLKPNEQTQQLMEHRGLKIDDKIIKELMVLGIPFLDFLFMEDNNTKSIDEREKIYSRIIEQSPIGLSQIIIHPGFDDEELRNITSDSVYRYQDLSIFINPKMKQLIDNANIKRIGWRDLTMTT